MPWLGGQRLGQRALAGAAPARTQEHGVGRQIGRRAGQLPAGHGSTGRASAVSLASSSSEAPPGSASAGGPCCGAGLGGSGRAGRCSASAASGLRRSMRSSTLRRGSPPGL